MVTNGIYSSFWVWGIKLYPNQTKPKPKTDKFKVMVAVAVVTFFVVATFFAMDIETLMQ
jgi:hypothetical protein